MNPITAVYVCEVKDEQGAVVARVTKTLYVRRMKK
jgi:acyl-coenzyme A thioesterase PaaI-like protein